MATQYNLKGSYVKIRETSGTLFNFGHTPIQLADSADEQAPSIILQPGAIKSFGDAKTVYARAYGGKPEQHAVLNVVDFNLGERGVGSGGTSDSSNNISDIGNDDSGNIVVTYKDGTTKTLAVSGTALKLDSEGYVILDMDELESEADA